jgi:hypothetical protein
MAELGASVAAVSYNGGAVFGVRSWRHRRALAYGGASVARTRTHCGERVLRRCRSSLSSEAAAASWNRCRAAPRARTALRATEQLPLMISAW